MTSYIRKIPKNLKKKQKQKPLELIKEFSKVGAYMVNTLKLVWYISDEQSKMKLRKLFHLH